MSVKQKYSSEYILKADFAMPGINLSPGVLFYFINFTVFMTNEIRQPNSGKINGVFTK